MKTELLFICGAQRCGTTYLYRALQCHPQISLAGPVRPEPKTFLSERFESAKDYIAYIEQSSSSTKQSDADICYFGEKGTTYIERPDAIERMLAASPTARFIILLRNPIKRAISNIQFSRENGYEELNDEQALMRELSNANTIATHHQISTDPKAYLKRSNYIDYLRPLADLITSDQLKILIMEELIEQPASSLKPLLSWLMVDDTYLSVNLSRPQNASQYDLSASGGITSEFQTRLQGYFEKSNQALAEEFDLDLSSWNQPI